MAAEPPPTTECVSQSGDGWFVEVTPDTLDVARFTAMVTAANCGAVAAFVGTTRDHFDCRRVVRLEYEAYGPMALRKMQDVCERAREKFGLEKIAVSHRTGVVPVAEASVVLAASSAHRRAALEGVQWALDELKQTVPVWKREVFEDGSQWKANDGSRPHAAEQGGGVDEGGGPAAAAAAGAGSGAAAGGGGEA